jgi:N-acetyl-gamma-glutamyl-phosphate reductase/acetylglutamate kinase
VTAAAINEMFQKRYSGERLIRIQKDIPVLRDVEGKHGFVVGSCQVSSSGERVVLVVSVSLSLFVSLFWLTQPCVGGIR